MEDDERRADMELKSAAFMAALADLGNYVEAADELMMAVVRTLDPVETDSKIALAVAKMMAARLQMNETLKLIMD